MMPSGPLHAETGVVLHANHDNPSEENTFSGTLCHTTGIEGFLYTHAVGK